jgi:prepilin-type N-terminal cleavage/methylation domain-containing protein
MKRNLNARGFSLIEILVVIAVMGTVLAIGASYITGKSAQRRSVDGVTNNISSMLHLGKLKSVRDGVEYRVVLARCDDIDESDPDCPFCKTDGDYIEYQAGDDEVSLILERGDSNAGSTLWCMQSEHSKRFQSDLNLVASANIGQAGEPLNFTFVPTGMRRDFGADAGNETLTIRPANDSKVENCGQLSVSPTGGITAVEGKWNGSNCIPILDSGASPTPGPS